MGQGQEVHAQRLMGQFLVTGGWVLLQNCHLSLDYIAEIMDQIVETESIHEDFRLWVTTEVHPKFPITFLQVIHTHTRTHTACRRYTFSERLCRNSRNLTLEYGKTLFKLSPSAYL
jgi:hypothetical protein